MSFGWALPESYTTDEDFEYSNFDVPHWFIAAAFAGLSLRALWRPLFRRRHVAGQCGSCGYDLRGTPDRCLECGAISAGSRGEDSPTKSTADEHGV
jgi:hypothetical protein